MFQFMVFDNPAVGLQDAELRRRTWPRWPRSRRASINILEPNFDRFAARGGKLIQYHGWADQQIPSGQQHALLQAVESHAGGRATFDDYYRMFMVPAMGHCGGGAGTTTFDMLTALEQWVEQGKAPSSIPASRVANGKTERTRPLCPFPQVAQLLGARQHGRRGQLQLQSPVTR